MNAHPGGEHHVCVLTSAGRTADDDTLGAATGAINNGPAGGRSLRAAAAAGASAKAVTCASAGAAVAFHHRRLASTHGSEGFLALPNSSTPKSMLGGSGDDA